MLAPAITFSGWATNNNIFSQYKKLFSQLIPYKKGILLEKKKIYIFIAYSMGSLYALEPNFIEKYCKKIIIFSGFLSFTNNDKNREKNIKKMIQQYQKNPINTLKIFYKNAQLNYPISNYAPPEKLLEQLYILEKKTIESSKEQKISFLNIYAIDDMIVPYQQSQKIKKLFPQYQELVLNTGGHGIILNQQKKIFPHIQKFLKESP